MPFIHSDQIKTVPLWINGKAHTPSNSSTFPIISSHSGDAVHNAVSASAVEAELACEVAGAAFKSWRKTTFVHRRKILFKVAEVYARRIDEIAAYQTAETSCHPQFAKWNIMKAIEYAQEIAASTVEMRGTICQRDTQQDGTEQEGLTLVVTEPVGTVLIIPP